MKTFEYYVVRHIGDKTILDYCDSKEVAEKWISERSHPEQYVTEKITMGLRDMNDYNTIREYSVAFNPYTSDITHQCIIDTVKKSTYPYVKIDKIYQIITVSSPISYEKCIEYYREYVKHTVNTKIKKLFNEFETLLSN